jgi:lysophospholipase L1-like esterase
MRASALASILLALGTPAIAAAPVPTLHGDQVLVVPHSVGRVQQGTAVTRTSAGSAIITVTATYQWPGTYFVAAFEGDEISVRLDDSANILTISVDGQLKDTLKKPGASVKTYKGLGKGQHVIRLERLTETQASTGTFIGFFAPKGKSLGINPRARQIEFIGDSYTVGYGNMSGKKQCTPDELHATTDTQHAYGPITAKAFKADYQINAFSGRGIVRNYDGFAGDPLPALYPYILFDKTTEYQDDSWKPQVIVIGLGGNDFSTPVKPGEKWKDDAALKADYEASFVAFVKTLRARNPQAFFLLTKYEGPVVAEEVEKVAAQLKAAGETRIDTIGLDGFTLNGCDWHLDSNDHKRISEQLTGYFNAHGELWQGK